MTFKFGRCSDFVGDQILVDDQTFVDNHFRFAVVSLSGRFFSVQKTVIEDSCHPERSATIKVPSSKAHWREVEGSRYLPSRSLVRRDRVAQPGSLADPMLVCWGGQPPSAVWMNQSG